MSKWFLLGFGTRAILAVVLSLIVRRNFEVSFLYLADLPTMMFFALAEGSLPDSWFRMLLGSDPYYLSMNLIGSLLWGGSFMLIPLTRNMLCRLRRNNQNLN
jgi:hypothetical protein